MASRMAGAIPAALSLSKFIASHAPSCAPRGARPMTGPKVAAARRRPILTGCGPDGQRAPYLFVEPPVAVPLGRNNSPLGLCHRNLVTVPGRASWLSPATVAHPRKSVQTALLTSWQRAKPLHSIGLPCSSCCVAPSSCGGGRHRRGIQHFLRQVACLEGRVLAGSQIRTVLLSQWVLRRHCEARPPAVTTALCSAAGHSGARQPEHRANTVVVSRMVWLSIEAPDWRRGAQRVCRPPVGRRPKARIDK
jgi:hypothetical protein